MNIVTVSAFRRPFHTRLCLESIVRAQRWRQWADVIALCVPRTSPTSVIKEIEGIILRSGDIPLETWIEDDAISSSPHTASKWMLDKAFSRGADMTLYVEDDAILSPDAFAMCEWTKQFALRSSPTEILGCCCYHETIIEQYKRENRMPDSRLLHLSNGLNTCGGTAFLQEPYLKYLAPDWNCKQVEPKGFDYSAHFLMYLHNLYMVWPDLSRSMNVGFSLGSIAPGTWAKYFGRSIWAQTADAVRDWKEFHFDGVLPGRVKEEWMKDELQYRHLSGDVIEDHGAKGQGQP
jgi:hypothetical protein